MPRPTERPSIRPKGARRIPRNGFAGLACDYDGTIATDGRVDAPTLRALEQARSSGWKLTLVTGRVLEDLRPNFDRLELFDRVVAENGAVLCDPSVLSERLLAPAPSPILLDELRRRQVTPVCVGRAIVSTSRRHRPLLGKIIRELKLPLRVVLNRDSAMVLPHDVHKGTGLSRALAEIGLRAGQVVGVGDAENDRDFLGLCGYSVAVANALPAVKQEVNFVTQHACGAGVVELIDQLL